MNKDNLFFNPGCALSLYKPEKEHQILSYLRENLDNVSLHNICCRHNPNLPTGSTIINVCAGCDRRFGSLYDGISTISLWEVMDRLDNFPFPDYSGARMNVHDACPVRNNTTVHKAVRSLLTKMNIAIVEIKAHGEHSVCCGDNLYPHCDLETVHSYMKRRADSMTCEDVVVYCVSCIKSIYIGGKTPHHLIDLLFNEATDPQEHRTDIWHEQLDEYIKTH